MRSALKRLSKCNDILNAVANVSAVIFIFILMVLVTTDVTMRYLFNSPVKGTYEIGTTLLVFGVFLALAYTQRKGSHIKVEILIRLVPNKIRNSVEIFTLVVAFFVFAAIAYQGTLSALFSWSIREFAPGVIDVPLYPAKAAVPVGATLFCLQLLVSIANRLVKAQPKEVVAG